MPNPGNYLPLAPVICGNCGKVNPPKTVLCGGCGINIEMFSEVEYKIHDLELSENIGEKSTNSKADERYTNENNRDRIRSVMVFGITIVSAILIGLTIVFGALKIKMPAEEKRSEAEELYQTAKKCLEAKDYKCAIRYSKQAKEKGLLLENFAYVLNDAYIGIGMDAIANGEPFVALYFMDECLQMNPSAIGCKLLKCSVVESLTLQQIDDTLWEKAINTTPYGKVNCPYPSRFKDLEDNAFSLWDKELMDKNDIINGFSTFRKREVNSSTE